MAEVTNTIELDLDKDQELDELTSEIRKKKIKIGKDELLLRVFISHSLNDFLYASLLFFLIQYFSKLKEESRQSGRIDSNSFRKTYDEIFSTISKNFDRNKIEDKIEKDFKVKIDIEKKNPLDEVFGIWKDHDISIDKIREKAWHRDH